MTTTARRCLGAVLAATMFLSGAVTAAVAFSAAPASAGTVLRTVNVGNFPTDVFSDGTHVWVDNQADNTVTELNASDGSVVRTIGGFASFLIGIVSDGAHVWVADHGGFVYELNTSDGSVVQTIPVLGEPQGIAYDGTDVWVSTDNEEVYKINASTGLVVDQIFVDGSYGIPQQISVAGGLVWVATNTSSANLIEIDASTDAIVRYVTMPAGCCGNSYAVLSDGTHVWVPNNHGGGSGTIAEVDASSGTLVQTINIGGQPRAMAYDGSHIWVTDDQYNIVTEINASDGSTVEVFTGVGDGTTGVSQDGTDVWTANPGSNTVSEIAIPETDLSITAGVNASGSSSSAAGGPVAFTVPVATDESAETPPVICKDPSNAVKHPGDVFPIGQTLLTCTATDVDDTPSTVSTTLTITMSRLPPTTPTVPQAPTIGGAVAGNGSATVSFAAPAYNGSDPVTTYTVTCVPSGGGASRSASGPYSPVTVSGLLNGTSYSCTVRATNVIGTGPPSNASIEITPSPTVSCTQTQSCNTIISTPASTTNPTQTVQVTGTPTDPTGTVTVTSAPGLLTCPGLPSGITAVTTLTDTGFPTTSSLAATVTQLAVATSPGKVCYRSTTPFRSVSHPTAPKAGAFILLQCSAVANVAPCQVSSRQTSSAIVVKFLAAGGDPDFRVVVPSGRLVWPSTFPTGKVGTAYAAHMQSSGGKAPFHWTIHAGKLAPGLTLNASSGAIAGKPTTKGKFVCIVVVSDSESPPKNATISVSITIA